MLSSYELPFGFSERAEDINSMINLIHISTFKLLSIFFSSSKLCLLKIMNTATCTLHMNCRLALANGMKILRNKEIKRLKDKMRQREKRKNQF
jgi:hypothetical protein